MLVVEVAEVSGTVAAVVVVVEYVPSVRAVSVAVRVEWLHAVTAKPARTVENKIVFFIGD
jgi:hypothetical protein